MNKFNSIMRRAMLCAAVLTAGAFAACSSSNDDSTPTPTPETGRVVLTPSATSMQVGGTITFRVTDNGADVTSQATIMNLTTMESVTDATFTTQRPGAYQFSAIYDNRSSATVDVTVRSEEGGGDNFFRKVLVHKFTATWCVNCPAMTNALNAVENTYPDRMIIVAMHSEDSYSIDEVTTLGRLFKVTGYPSAEFDYRELSNNYSTAVLNARVKRSIDEFPAICGIALNSKIANDKITVDASVKFTQGGNFKIVCLVTEDDLYAPGTVGSADSYYHHVCRAFATDSTGDTLGNRVAGETYNQTFEIPLNGSWVTDKCHVVVYVLNEQSDGSYFVNNGATCAAVGSVDYAYEPAA